MKKISKKKLDKAIALTKAYWQSDIAGDRNILNKLHNMSTSIQADTDLEWTAVLDLLHGIFKYKGICPDATNDEVYCALRCLGWEATDEEHPAE